MDMILKAATQKRKKKEPDIVGVVVVEGMAA